MVSVRVIGKYVGKESGPLLVIMAAMHGNEPAGVKALDLLFKMLEVEPITNPGFIYKGEIIGMIGNVEAYQLGKRYISQDINRLWIPSYIQEIKKADKSSLENEDFEIREILDIIDLEISKTRADKVYLLDLHTTSSDGIFCIATNEEESIKIAKDIHAPVILGLLYGIEGTTLHYFTESNLGLPTTGIAFEGGSHDDPLSVNRCIAATINFMRTIGTIKADDVENRHDQILIDYAANLPKLVEAFYKFPIDEPEEWHMLPGFKNFDTVYKGQILATYKGEPVQSLHDGFLLMPLYQKQGSDGFFIVRNVS